MLTVAAMIYITPAVTVQNHGIYYRELANNPFRFEANNIMQSRILTPLLAHYLHLRGDAYLVLPLIMGIVFLAAIYVYFRKQGFDGAEALGMAGLMAFSTPILFQLYFQGYTDITSHLFVFLALVSINRHWLWPVFYALALLNHESGLFVAPLLLLSPIARSRRPSRVLITLVLLSLAVIPMYLFRQYVETHGNLSLDGAYYLNMDRVRHCMKMITRYLWLGIFEAFKLFWVFPLVAIPHLLRTRRVVDGLFLVAAILCALAQLLLATDTSRLMGLAFPAILFGAVAARQKWGKELFVRRLWMLIGFNFLVPQYYIGQFYAFPFFPLPISLIAKWLFDVDLKRM